MSAPLFGLLALDCVVSIVELIGLSKHSVCLLAEPALALFLLLLHLVFSSGFCTVPLVFKAFFGGHRLCWHWGHGIDVRVVVRRGINCRRIYHRGHRISRKRHNRIGQWSGDWIVILLAEGVDHIVDKLKSLRNVVSRLFREGVR